VSRKLIAVVDDEADILELVSHHLLREGYTVKQFQNGREFLSFTQSLLPDLVILDLMLPGADGLEICRILKNSARTSSVPILMLTAKGTEADIVVGLEMGADDYVVKPFSPRELVARVKSILRRASEDKTAGSTITIGPLMIDTERFEATVDGKKLQLTTSEFRILELLARFPGKVFTRDEVIKKKRMWGDDKLVYDRTIDVHIKNIREKMGRAGSMIKTIRGIGYKLEA
jgi:DNA-binding response OmpR family regulator